MRIDPLGGATRPGAGSAPATSPHRNEQQPADRVDLTDRSAHSSESSGTDIRAHRLEALREAIAAGRYHLPDEVIARAILRAAVERHGRPV